MTVPPQLIDALAAVPGLKAKANEPLARYTSIRIGGPADLFIRVETAEALRAALRLLEKHRVPFYLLGKGSNVLVSDRGVRGAVIRLAGEFDRALWSPAGGQPAVVAGAAYPLARLAREAVRRGLSGLEFAEGIPASVGGAVVMNAGAYGSEMERVIDRVEALTAGGEPLSLARGELIFSYREAQLPAASVVTRVAFSLAAGEPAAMRRRLDELLRRRKQSQPAGLPNAGSMFRNPPGDFAGRLIEAAGLKGRRVGQAEISERHANFIVNLGGATAAQVRRLMEIARAEVRARFAIELVPEVKFFGDWTENGGAAA